MSLKKKKKKKSHFNHMAQKAGSQDKTRLMSAAVEKQLKQSHAWLLVGYFYKGFTI